MRMSRPTRLGSTVTLSGRQGALEYRKWWSLDAELMAALRQFGKVDRGGYKQAST